MEQEKIREERRKKIRKNIFFTLVVAVGYVIVYLVGRIFGTTGQQTSVIGWLFGDDPAQLSYLYGWLLHQNIFWIAMAVSVIPALFGKKYFSFTTLAGFALGLLIGELVGQNPAGAAYGHGIFERKKAARRSYGGLNPYLMQFYTVPAGEGQRPVWPPAPTPHRPTPYPCRKTHKPW